MLEILISSSVLIMVLAILRLVLRDKISARLQYALWFLVLVRLLVPVSFFQSPVSVAEAAAPVTERVWYASHMVIYLRNTAPVPEQALSDPSEHEEGSVVTPGQALLLRDTLLLAWYAGMVVMAAWLLLVNIRLARRLRRNRTPYDSDSDLSVYVAEGIPSPCLFGLFKPSIYLTERAAEDDMRARQIIAHELTHYRHGDMIWALLRSVCLVVWWFNPLVWLAAALSRQDCELACDEGTIKALGEDARFDYGRTLVGMAKVGARPSDLLCGATTMTTGKKSLKERVARIANAPKMSVIAVILALCVAVVAVGCTFSGAAERAPVESEVAVEVPASASPSDAEDRKIGSNVKWMDPNSEEIYSLYSDYEDAEELYEFYLELKNVATKATVSNKAPTYEAVFNVRFLEATNSISEPVLDAAIPGFLMWTDGTFLVFSEDGGDISSAVYDDEDGTMTERFTAILEKYEYPDAFLAAAGAPGEVIGGYDRVYWEEVDRELASFAYPADIEVSVADGFDEALPEDDIFGPMTLEDYIYGTDSWQFEYNSEMPTLDPDAQIIVYDADGRALWIEADMDALMVEEADGSITSVTYAGDPVDCTDMIRHLLPWARGEEFGELPTDPREAIEAAIVELGSFALPGLEPVKMEGGVQTPFWVDLFDQRNPSGPCAALFYGTNEMSADLRYERMYQNGDPARSLGSGSYVMCRSFFAESETVTDVKVGGMNGFVTDGNVYAGPRIVWYDADADLLFSLIAYHFDGDQNTGTYSTEELIALAESVAAKQ